MDYLITAIVLAIWSFLWYKLGYIQAEIIEIKRRRNDLYKINERNVKELEKTIASVREMIYKNEKDINGH